MSPTATRLIIPYITAVFCNQSHKPSAPENMSHGKVQLVETGLTHKSCESSLLTPPGIPPPGPGDQATWLLKRFPLSSSSAHQATLHGGLHSGEKGGGAVKVSTLSVKVSVVCGALLHPTPVIRVSSQYNTFKK